MSYMQDQLDRWEGERDTDSQPGVNDSGSFTPNAFNQLITDKSSFSITIDSGSRNAIQWIAAKERIIIGTTGGEWRLSGHSNKPITPTNYDVKIQTVWGSKDMQPLVLHEAVLFVDFVGKKLREIVWDGIDERYRSPDLLLLAEHITKSGGITTMAYQKNPDSIIWATLANGDLISCTYVKEQDVIAWARHPLPVGGEAEASKTIPATEGYSGYLTDPEYPTLRELTADEIPDTPPDPPDAPLSSPTTVDDYASLQSMVTTGHYTMASNIDLDGETWTPIVNFSGILEGNGHTISNLSIDNSSDVQGFFASFNTGAEIRNLTFENCSISAGVVIGLLCARVNDEQGEIILKNIKFNNCTLTGGDYIGFLVGEFGGTGTKGTYSNRIYDCDVVSCTLNALAGSDSHGMLIGFYPTNRQAVGLSYIVRCTSQGGQVNVATGCNNISAFVGKITTTPQYSTSGGFYECYTTTPIVAAGEQTQMGSFCSKLVGFDVVSCYATGDITITVEEGTAQHGARGISAFVAMYELVEKSINCYSTGNITIDGSNNTDGFMNATGHFGGFAGFYLPLANSNILRCYATGNITLIGDIRGWEGIGGFVGEISMHDVNILAAVIQRSWAEGDITLEVADRAVLPNGVGGFVGDFYSNWVRSYDITIQNCYAWGSITFTDNTAKNVIVGGFFGSEYTTQATTLTVDNCYSAQTNIATGSGLTGQVPVTDESGGFWGGANVIVTEPVVTDSFWDTTTSSVTEDNYAVGHITSWMQTPDNFTDAGWDLDTIWYMPTPVFWWGENGYESGENDNSLGANSVCVIPGSTEDEIWISVGRSINGSLVRYVERMSKRYWGVDQEDAFFVDSGLSYDGDPTDTFSGLDHLEGETVAILGDGAVFPTQTVTDGSITLPESVSVCHIGLPYTYVLKPMRFDQNVGGTSKGSIKKASRMVISFLKTLNARYGDGTTTRGIDFRTTEAYTTPPALFTGDKVVILDVGYSVDDPAEITGSDPLPATIRCLIPHNEVTGD